jgi:hypothetical protein
MAVNIPQITKAIESGGLAYVLNWLIAQINTQNVAGTSPAAFPG